MAVTRIKGNQITNATITADKLADGAITGAKLTDDMTYGSNLTVTGNLTVSGTTSTIDTTNTTVADPYIMLNSGASGSPTVDGGIIINRGSSDNATMYFDESEDKFVFGTTTDDGTTAGNINLAAGGIVVATFEGDITGDLTGDVTGNVTGDLTGDVTGNVTGNVTGDLTGDVTGNVTGDLTGDSTGAHNGTVGATTPATIVGTTITANTNFAGDLTGDVTGNVTGNVDGIVGGTTPAAGTFTTVSAPSGFTGNLTGNVTGSVTGDVTGDLTGDVTGDVTGNVTGDLTGDVTGDVTGDLTGASTGAHNGTVGATTPATIVGTTITANTNFAGDLTGNVTSAGTSTFATIDINTAMTVGTSVTFDASTTIDAGDNKITNMADPTDDQDASTKAYVDAQIGGAANSIFELNSNVLVTDTGTDGKIAFNIDGAEEGKIDADGFTFGNIRIDGGTIRSTSGDLTIDPTPDGSGGNLIVAGNLTVQGTTTTVDSTVVTIADPIFQVGADSNDSLDRGIVFLHNDGASKKGYFGADMSETGNEFVYIPEATDTASVMSGSLGAAAFGSMRVEDLTAGDLVLVGTNGELQDGPAYDGSVLTSGLTGDVTGNVTGDLTGASTGAHNGTVGATTPATGAFTTVSSSAGFTGDLTGDVTGDITGDLTGDVTGNVTGNVTGDLTGDSTGAHNGTVGATTPATIVGTTITANTNFSGDLTGDVTGDVTGDLTGDSTGAHNGTVGATTPATIVGTTIGGTVITASTNFAGDLTGDVTGDTAGTHTGDVTGNVTGNLTGDVTGDLTGSVTAGSGETVNVALGTLTLADDQISGDKVSGGLIDTFASTGIDDNATSNQLTISDTNADFGGIVTSTSAIIGSTTATTGATLKVDSTDSLMIPAGTTAQRPDTGVQGMFRYNSTTGSIEVYTGSEWNSGADFTVIEHDAFSGDDSTVAFTLSIIGTTATTIVAINGVLQIPTTAYAVSGTTLTFTEAPATGDVIDARVLTTTDTIIAIADADGDTKIHVDEVLDDDTIRFDVAGSEVAKIESTGLTVTGNIVATGTIQLGDNAASDQVTVNATFNGDIIPNADDTHDLGSASAKYAEVHATTYYGDGSNLTGIDATAIQNGTTSVQTANDADVTITRAGSTHTVFDTNGITLSVGTFNGTATSAQYADLAEMYSADGEIAPGTIVCFGGDAEVTTCMQDADKKVAGVVSTNPAYLMNSEAEGVAVALTGRVPCKVTGAVAKGDMMVSAGNGMARAEANPAMGSVIGKALANHAGGEGIIEVVVGRM
ncbi:hypothetical protein N9Z41_01970 [bacterium]|nr:hypothetical protein [bacterium]